MRVPFPSPTASDSLQSVPTFFRASVRACLGSFRCGDEQTSADVSEEAAHCRIGGSDDRKIWFDKEDDHHVKVVPCVIVLQSVIRRKDEPDDYTRRHTWDRIVSSYFAACRDCCPTETYRKDRPK